MCQKTGSDSCSHLMQNLHNYFNIHVCPSLRRRRHVTSHFQVSSRLEFQKPSQTAAGRGVAELRILDFKTTWSEFQKPSQTAAERGVAKLRILDFKTTWSEFQKPSQTAAERGVAELRILDFKTTWSEFQRPSQTTAKQGEAELHIFNFKTTWSESQNQVRPLLSEAKPSCVYSI